eukprot:TRINITY_DN115534_c0_g1_i1.p1 TRINITY_DN115534_c0_g1~~TRINITY_DN115534_c0_g1_i1.p1  ORF type:complete len:346 (+),score=26.74 TRINITY_DN115534_c0_g1_i1:47-1039(+)
MRQAGIGANDRKGPVTAEMRPSQSKNLPGQVQNAWRRRERTVIGSSNRKQEKIIERNSQPHAVKAHAAATKKLATNAALYSDNGISNPNANLLRTQFHHEEKEAGVPQAQNSMKFTDGYRGHLAGSSVAPVRTTGVRSTTSASPPKVRGEREQSYLPSLNNTRASCTASPTFTTPLEPATRLGRTMYVDTHEITQPDEKSALYSSPQQGFRRLGMSEKVDYSEEKQKQANRLQAKLERRRANEERVLQAYDREERAKILAQDNRALRYTHQRLQYLERIAEADKFYTMKNKTMPGGSEEGSARLNVQFGDRAPSGSSSNSSSIRAPWGTD